MINLNDLKSFVCKIGRPLGVTILGYLELFLLGFFISYGLYTGITTNSWPGAGVAVILMSSIAIILPIAWLKGKKWTWYIQVIFTSLSILGGLIKLDSLKIIIQTVIVIYCFRKNVRQYFRIKQENTTELNQGADIPSVVSHK